MKIVFFFLFFIIFIAKASSQEIPEDYPNDVPKPIASKFMGMLKAEEGTVCTFISKLSAEVVYESFKEEIEKNGYVLDEKSDVITNENGGLAFFNKGTKKVGLLLGASGVSTIVLTYK